MYVRSRYLSLTVLCGWPATHTAALGRRPTEWRHRLATQDARGWPSSHHSFAILMQPGLFPSARCLGSKRTGQVRPVCLSMYLYICMHPLRTHILCMDTRAWSAPQRPAKQTGHRSSYFPAPGSQSYFVSSYRSHSGQLQNRYVMQCAEENRQGHLFLTLYDRYGLLLLVFVTQSMTRYDRWYAIGQGVGNYRTFERCISRGFYVIAGGTCVFNVFFSLSNLCHSFGAFLVIRVF